MFLIIYYNTFIPYYDTFMMEELVDPEQIEHLIEITSCTPQEAEFLLGASGGDLAIAVQLYKGAKK